jgi:hypothetical protein
VLTTPERKESNYVTTYSKKPRNPTDPFVRPKQWPLGRPRRRYTIILQWIFERLDDGGGGGIDWIDLVQDRGRWRYSCGYGDEPSGSIKCGKFLEYLRTC